MSTNKYTQADADYRKKTSRNTQCMNQFKMRWGSDAYSCKRGAVMEIRSISHVFTSNMFFSDGMNELDSAVVLCLQWCLNGLAMWSCHFPFPVQITTLTAFGDVAATMHFQGFQMAPECSITTANMHLVISRSGIVQKRQLEHELATLSVQSSQVGQRKKVILKLWDNHLSPVTNEPVFIMSRVRACWSVMVIQYS